MIAPTFQEYAVERGDQRPDIRRPIRMVKPARKWEEAAEQLRELAHEEEGAERDEEDGDDGVREGDEARREEGPGGCHAKGTEQVDEVCRLRARSGRGVRWLGQDTYGKVHINVLEVQQHSKEEATSELVALHTV